MPKGKEQVADHLVIKVCHGLVREAVLSKEGQGETEHRLSREDGERLEKLHEAADQLAVQLSPVKTARTEQNMNTAHEMAERLRVELRRLSQGDLSEAGLRAAAQLAHDEIIALVEWMADSGLVEEGGGLALYQKTKPLVDAQVELAKALALSQPPQDDVEGLREKLLAVVEQMENKGADDCSFWACDGPEATEIVPMKTCARCAAAIELRDLLASPLLAVPAPDVERLGGDRELRERVLGDAKPLIARALLYPEQFTERRSVPDLPEGQDEPDEETNYFPEADSSFYMRAIVNALGIDFDPSRPERLDGEGDSEEAKKLATIRSWCDDSPAGHKEAGGWLLASRVAELIDAPTTDPCASSGKSSPEQPKNPPVSSGSPLNSSGTRSGDSRAPSSSPQPHTDSGRSLK